MPVLEAMSKIWRVVGYDYGEASETTARPEDVTVEELVGEIFGVMGALGVERCTLGGFSSGAPITMLAVSQHSDQFDGLVILSDTTRFLEEPGERVYLDTYIDHYDERIEKAVVAFTPEPDVAHIYR